jgi:hypothetical protein
MTSNIYPADVRIGYKGNVQQEYSGARIRTNNDETRIQVWVLGQHVPRRPECVVDSEVIAVVEPYNQFATLKNRHAQWQLADGTFVYAQAMPGCGCGSPLKQLPVWRNQPQAVGV